MPGAIPLTTYTTFGRLWLKEKEISRFPHFIFRVRSKRGKKRRRVLCWQILNSTYTFSAVIPYFRWLQYTKANLIQYAEIFLAEMRFTTTAKLFPTIIEPQHHHRIHKILRCITCSRGSALVPTARSFQSHFNIMTHRSRSLQLMNPNRNILHSSQFQSVHDKLGKKTTHMIVLHAATVLHVGRFIQLSFYLLILNGTSET
jgi:hypothetical protein